MVPVEDHSAETESTAIQAQPQVSTGTHRDNNEKLESQLHLFLETSVPVTQDSAHFCEQFI